MDAQTGRDPDFPIIAGVLNVTPDSFSDGGHWYDTDRAVAHGKELVKDGADWIDIGGESTRPGAERVSPEQEAERVLGAIQALAASHTVSIDTMRASTARRAVAAGATVVNDISGGLADPEMLATIAELGTTCILGHWRGHSADMYRAAEYKDVARETRDELIDRADAAIVSGVPIDRIWLDPGVGFAKTAEQSWAILQSIGWLTDVGYPIMVGLSRKSFLTEVMGGSTEVTDRDLPSAILAGLLAEESVAGLRVHDVKITLTALRTMKKYTQTGIDDDE